MLCKCGSVKLMNAAVCRMIGQRDGCYLVEVYAPDDTLLKKSDLPLPFGDALTFIHETMADAYYPHFHWEQCAMGAEILQPA